GTFERRLTLPSNLDEEACSADFKDGVLTITLPKAEKARGRRNPLGGGSQPRPIQAPNDREQASQQPAAEEPGRRRRQNQGDRQRRTIEAQNEREEGSMQQAAEGPERWSRQSEGGGRQG